MDGLRALILLTVGLIWRLLLETLAKYLADIITELLSG